MLTPSESVWTKLTTSNQNLIKFKCKDNSGKWAEQQRRKSQRGRRPGLNMGTQIGSWRPMSFCIHSNSSHSILLIIIPISWVATPWLAVSSLVKIRHKMVRASPIYRTCPTRSSARLFRMPELYPSVNMTSRQRRRSKRSRFRCGTSTRLGDHITLRIPTMSMIISTKNPVSL
jgi:hypothetical protein